MFLKAVLALYLISLVGIQSITAREELCDYREMVIPQGIVVGTVNNVKFVSDCCTHCNVSNPCTAYSYHRVSEQCRLFNHTTFATSTDGFVISGIVLPPGGITEIVEPTTPTPVICPANNTNPSLKFPHPYDCSLYYRCLSSQMLLESCWDGDFFMLYDHRLKQCKDYDTAECIPGSVRPTHPPSSTTTTRPTSTSTTMPTTSRPPLPVECPPTGIIDIAHPTDCTKFIRCTNGVGTEYSCPEGEKFDSVSGSCTDPESATCFQPTTNVTETPTSTTSVTTPTTSRPPLPVECPPTGIIDIPHPDDCTKFVRCINGNGMPYDCPQGEHFDSVSGTCMDPELATCFQPPTTNATQTPPTSTTTVITTTTITMATTTTRPTTTPPTTTPTTHTVPPSTGGPTTTTTMRPGECPPTGIVKVPHPYDCTKYISCINGNGVEMQCEDGQWFDYIRTECASSTEANCYPTATIDPIPPSSTTTESTGQPVTAPGPTTAGTTQRPIPEEPEECPPSGIVNISHPTDCTKYYQCINGNPLIRDCPANQKFDYWDKICVAQDSARCFNG